MATSRLKVIGRMAAMVVVPSVPVLVWWKYARDDRQRRFDQVTTKVRVPNVQTIDDLMVEKCQPGDVILFDRRCESVPRGLQRHWGVSWARRYSVGMMMDECEPLMVVPMIIVVRIL